MRFVQGDLMPSLAAHMHQVQAAGHAVAATRETVCSSMDARGSLPCPASLQEELGAACRSYLQHKQAAPLAPHTGPDEVRAASVLGGSRLEEGQGQGREVG